MKLERALSQWAGVNPTAIASASPAAVTYFAADAQKDIATLAAAYDEMGRTADARKVIIAAKDAEIARLREVLSQADDFLRHNPDAGQPPRYRAQQASKLIRFALKEQTDA